MAAILSLLTGALVFAPSLAPTDASNALEVSTSASRSVAAPGEVPSPMSGTPSAGEGGDRSGLIDSALREHVRGRAGSHRVRVEVVGGDGAPYPALLQAVVSTGGTLVDTYAGLVLADVRVQDLARLERVLAVRLVRLPLSLSRVVRDEDAAAPAGPSASIAGEQDSTSRRASADSDIGTGTRGKDVLAKVGIDAWQREGYRGGGVAIGVIDSFSGYRWEQAVEAGELPARPASTFCLDGGAPCDIAAGTNHGVGVAEILLDLAPEAQLHLATVSTGTDYRAAIDHFAQRGVRVISRSMYGPYDGAGDGTGQMADLIAYAEARGMVWVNAAGNSAAGPARPMGSYFRAAWTDENADGWLDVTADTAYLPVFCSAAQGFYLVGARWSDWAESRSGGASDYDVFLYDEQGGEPYASFASRQTDGATPVEAAGFTRDDCPEGDDWDYLAVRVADPGAGVNGDVFEVMVAATGLGYHSNPGSATQPAGDIVSPGSFSVGAVDPAIGTLIAPYSSQGPSNDGRIEPDISAPSNVSNFTFGRMRGTSAATPHVSGMLAVLMGANSRITPIQIGEFLRTQVVDRGTEGPDSVYGAGEISLSAPAPRSTPDQGSPVRPGKLRRVRAWVARNGRIVITWRAPRTGRVGSYRAVVKRGRKVVARKGLVAQRRAARITVPGAGRRKVIVHARNGSANGPRVVRRVSLRR